jgi:rieske iron-sulfur protein
MNCSGCPQHSQQDIRRLSRRTILKSVIGAAGLSLQLTESASGAEKKKKKDDPRKIRPQAGDELVYPFWEKDGRMITLEDIPLGGPPVLVYPRDPETQVARDRSRLNQILLVRFAPEELSQKTQELAVEGIIAYSGVCTHTGCTISEWDTEKKHFTCPCHSSAFDPKERAQIQGGPAPKPLPALPLQLTEGKLTVAGPFTGKVGGKKK